MAVDIRIVNHGSLYGFTGISEAGEAWLEENIPHADVMGATYYVEHRYALNVAQGAMSDGLEVE